MLTQLNIDTPRGEALIDITKDLHDLVGRSSVADGLCVLFVPHTTAAITINSALDPATPQDILHDLRRLVPTRVDFNHQYDTPADAAGHIKAALIGHSITLILAGGKLVLGGSQSVLFCEFDGPRKRQVRVKIMAG
jgi:secondary thiamine-phosphate synthase enzyme